MVSHLIEKGKMLMAQSVDEVLADRDYWLQLEPVIGGRLYGFSYRDTASYSLAHSGGHIQVNRSWADYLLGAHRGEYPLMWIVVTEVGSKYKGGVFEGTLPQFWDTFGGGGDTKEWVRVFVSQLFGNTVTVEVR